MQKSIQEIVEDKKKQFTEANNRKKKLEEEKASRREKQRIQKETRRNKELLKVWKIIQSKEFQTAFNYMIHMINRNHIHYDQTSIDPTNKGQYIQGINIRLLEGIYYTKATKYIPQSDFSGYFEDYEQPQTSEMSIAVYSDGTIIIRSMYLNDSVNVVNSVAELTDLFAEIIANHSLKTKE